MYLTVKVVASSLFPGCHSGKACYFRHIHAHNGVGSNYILGRHAEINHYQQCTLYGCEPCKQQTEAYWDAMSGNISDPT